jgi:lipopolysaccharide transport system permease protein
VTHSQVLAERPVNVIEPRRGWTSLGLAELWEYRELLYFLTWRDIKVRYKQTVLGAAWAFLQPFLTMIVFSLFFGRLAKVPSDGIPYPLFSFTALVPWSFFAGGITQSANSLVGSANLIRKIYFPRLVVPISSILAGLVDFAVSFAVLVGALMPWFHYSSPEYSIDITTRVLWLPLLLLLELTTLLGVGLLLSALNVQFRDVRYTLPFVVQLWLFATPIAYPASLVPEAWRPAYALNPMVGVVEGFRWALLGTGTDPRTLIAVSSVAACALLAIGAIYFRRMERTFADVV